jgi:N-acetylneuraminic acid mutarotase
MLGRDVDSSPIQYRTWVVNDTPDFTGALYTGDKSGPSPLVDVTAYEILDPSVVANFNLPNAEDWSTTRRVLPCYTCDSQTAVIDGYVYLFGGQNSSKILRAPVNNPGVWADTGAKLPIPLAGSQLAIVNNSVYLFGGTTDATFGTPTNAVLSAPTSNPLNWTNDGYILPKNLHHSQLGIIDGYMYLFGGYDGYGPSKAILSAPTSSPLSWSDTGQTLPDPLYGSQLAIVDGYAILFGGLTTNNTTTKNIYSAPINTPTTWSFTSFLPFPCFYGQFATVGNQGFLFTPTDGYVSPTRILRCQLSNPFSWIDTKTSIPGEVSQSQLAIIYDRLFLFGGNGSTIVFANNSLLKYKLDDVIAVSYGSVTRTQVNATPNKLDLFVVLGFPPWKTDYGA